MAKHGCEFSSDTKINIIELIKNGLRARNVALRLNINESTISNSLKRWRQRGYAENVRRPGRSKSTPDHTL